jgi:spoIIIJ-associated protein
VNKERPEQADIATQAEVACSFLEGLIEAFGLEAEVASRIEEDILFLDVSGEQSEALVGQRGAVLDSVLELTRTVVQRKTFGAPRMRLDIAGYTERRREALRIYARKLADKVKESGGEIGLEPMNPADRKVVHDAIAEIDGVRSFSEGQDQDRAVVIAPDGSGGEEE